MTDKQHRVLQIMADPVNANLVFHATDREMVAVALEEIDRLRAAGDAMAKAVDGAGPLLFLLGCRASLVKDRDSWKASDAAQTESKAITARLDLALTVWRAARGDS